MSEWAYEMSNEKLVDEFAQTCGRSGASNSGLCIDIMGPSYAAKAHYLRGVLFARLEGLKPPFKPDDIVKPKSDQRIRSVDYWGSSISHDAHQTIHRVYYDGNGRWLLDFEGISSEEMRDPRFNANDFVLESSVATAGK
jgi:hypothetical protein